MSVPSPWRLLPPATGLRRARASVAAHWWRRDLLPSLFLLHLLSRPLLLGRRGELDCTEAAAVAAAAAGGGEVSAYPRRRAPWGTDFRDIALPLGMSFAAVVAQICSLAVKEAVEDVSVWKRFDNFIRNFQKSFSSTLKTLQVIKEESSEDRPNCAPWLRDHSEASSSGGNMESLNTVTAIEEKLNQELGQPSRRGPGSGFSQSTLSTFERSIAEQARSNDLKALEIGLNMEKLQLKRSQLYLSSHASFLERIKISMNIAKSTFREEKLKTQIKDTRQAELARTCLDLLIAGLILMSCLLGYGAYTFSYRRISEATASCNSLPKETKSWWVPKNVASFSSGWLSVRCHVVVISRMSFGLFMILSVAYSAFLRSSAAGAAMPVTFILILLGTACGAAGKFCVDTLGGSGYTWLLYWETLCLLHFLASAFPSSLYQILHGPVTISSKDGKVMMPYWARRSAFYAILVLILPVLSGLTPFASVYEWGEHLVSKLAPWSYGAEE
ncbi:unnamed protein product [Spirodela intermedia]|uniref:Uncharacterized protein n=1 Tax=Spirodela intermedia TaxID=51605 RepID=A0A7I8IPL0_SPIIN|nr:unnamed protein product [Spirodela intermedia]CAA6659413.1 unnamed protein product [Spirodela intermedia]